ncbi:helix-turn-helix domain-containing protein [Simplicispira metamorpha]|uniref:Xre family transcriptional regulator n=1 Tax=Simplicispira metamorpha TaxID=80881 RepID=A0A4R2N554_9BURK|nr:Xre family transcriptional regulator [Simplicispira metamorpha]
MRLEEAFGRLLKEQRSLKNLTQADLALRSGIAVSFVSRMERCAACPTIDTLFKLARALDVPPEILVSQLRERLVESPMA